MASRRDSGGGETHDFNVATKRCGHAMQDSIDINETEQRSSQSQAHQDAVQAYNSCMRYCGTCGGVGSQRKYIPGKAACAGVVPPSGSNDPDG